MRAEKETTTARGLRYFMLLTGKKQADVAKIVGRHQSTISSWCLSKTEPGVDEWAAIKAKLAEARKAKNGAGK